MVAWLVPVVSTPKGAVAVAVAPSSSSAAGNPVARVRKSTHATSTSAAAWFRPPQLEFIVAATRSAAIELGSPAPCTQPKNRGFVFPVAWGMMSSTRLSRTSGSGRPAPAVSPSPPASSATFAARSAAGGTHGLSR